MNTQIKRLTQGAMIAALYTVLTIFISAFNLASGAIQVRISEALTILPAFTPAAVPGLFVGCLISNIITGCALPDIIFGSLATLIGGIGTYFISHGYYKKTGKGKAMSKYMAPLPPILANTIIVPFVLKYAYGVEGMIPFLALTVGIGEILSCGLLGLILMNIIEKRLLNILGDHS